MKTIDLLCPSQAATSTVTMDASAAVSGRAIDRHNPIIQDQKRLTTRTPLPPPSTTKKINPPKNTTDQKRKTINGFADENKNQQLITNKNNYVVRRQGGVLLRWGCTRPGDFISPATSSRYLLTDKALSDQFDPLLNQVSPPPPPTPVKLYDSDGDKSIKKDDGRHRLSPSPPPKSPTRSSLSSSSRSSDHQVVVLRVSLHCRGCEKKMRKHISKMEGVTSFNIDFMAKKVTVVGDITPLAVLTSVSKVKNAKLLTPTTLDVPPVASNLCELKKQFGLVT